MVEPVSLGGLLVPASLVARDVTVTIGRMTVLDHVALTVTPGHRYGLVGPNGVGKSTLLRVLAGLVQPDPGRVERQPKTATVGLLDQEAERPPDETARAYLSRRTGVAAATNELQATTVALASAHRVAPAAAERYDTALHTWLNLGGADHEARVEATMALLALAPRLLDQPMTTLSGGEAAKFSLAALLLAGHDVLLLDEPTNDLDLEGLERLEAWVLDQDRAMVIVSHDRAFLERTVTDVVELDEHSRHATTFGGGWIAYRGEKATARRHAEEAYAGYAAKREELLSRAQRERQWSSAGFKKAKRDPPDNDKSLRSIRMEASENLAAKARRTEQALARLQVVDKPWEPWDLHFEIAQTKRSGDLVAALEHATVEWGGFRLGPIDLEIGWAERVGIVGSNGSGKTTLLDTLIGRLPLDSGRQRLGPAVVVGEVEQTRRRLDGGATLLDAMLAASRLTVSEARSLLAKFGLGPNAVVRPTRSLSPGERTRATLALLMAQGVNCLVLDEPTNHLDLPAIEQLEQAVAGFDGTLMLVTHDRRLLESVSLTRIVRLEAGRVVADEQR
jgi:ATPase subunit of ABC transporter with duplicated ATPase domains